MKPNNKIQRFLTQYLPDADCNPRALFGNGFCELERIKLEKGLTLHASLLTGEALSSAYQNSPHITTELQYLSKSFLSLVAQEYQQFISDFYQYLATNDVTIARYIHRDDYLPYHISCDVYIDSISDEHYFQFKLSNLLRYNGRYFVMSDRKLVAYVFVQNNQYKIVAQENIYFTQDMGCQSIVILSDKKIIYDYKVEMSCYSSEKRRNELIISANEIDFCSSFDDADETAYLKTVNFFCGKTCEIKSNIYAQDIQIKAGTFINKAVLQAENTFYCLSEQHYNYRIINSHKLFMTSYINIQSSQSRLNAQEIMNQGYALYSQGHMTCDEFNQICVHAHWNMTQLTANKAHVFCSQHLEFDDNVNIFTDGNIHLFSKNYQRIIKSLKIQKKGNLFSGLTPTVHIAARYLEILGKLETAYVRVNIHADFFDLKGTLQLHAGENVFSAINAPHFQLDGLLTTEQPCHIETSDFTQHGVLRASNAVLIQTDNARLQSGSTITAKELVIKSKNDIAVDDKSDVTASDRVMLSCKNFYNHGKLASRVVMIQALHKILLGGHISADEQIYAALLFYRFGGLTADQLSIRAALSFHLGLRKTAYSQQSGIANIFLGVSWFKKGPSPHVDFLHYAIAATRMALTVGTIVTPFTCPVAAPVILGLNIGLDAILNARGAYRSATKFCHTVSHLPTKLNALDALNVLADTQQLVIDVTSFLTSMFHVCKFKIKIPEKMHWKDLTKKDITSIVYDLSYSTYSNYKIISPTNSNTALFNINAGLMVGDFTDNHLVSVNAGFGLLLSSTNKSVFFVDLSQTASVGPQTYSGNTLIRFGSNYHVLGQNSYHYNTILLGPGLNHQHTNESIQSDYLRIVGDQTFTSVTIQTNTLKTTGHNNVQTSVIGAQTWTQQGSVSGEKNYIKVQEHIIQSSGEFIQHQTFYSTSDTTIRGTFTGDNLQIDGSNLSLDGGYFELYDTTMDLSGDYDTNGDVHFKNVNVHAHMAKMDNTIDFKDVGFQTDEKIQIEETAQFTGEQAFLQSKEIHYAGHADIKGRVEMVATDALTTTAGSSFSGEGLIYLSCDIGTLGGQTTTADFVYINNHFGDTNQLIHQEGAYQTIKPSHAMTVKTNQAVQVNTQLESDIELTVIGSGVDISADISGKQGLTFIATTGDVTASANTHAKNLVFYAENGNVMTDKHTYSADEDTIMYAKKNYTNQGGDVIGKDTTIVAETGDASNSGGLFRGTNHLAVQAGHDVNNITTVNGQYKNGMVTYNQGNMQGGSGDGYEGVGVFINAGNVVNNVGATIHSQGKNQIIGEHGVNLTALTNTYLSKDEKHKKWLGLKKKHTKEYTTQVQKSTVFSVHDKNEIYSPEGGILSEGGEFVAKKGTDLISQQTIKLVDVKGITEKHTSKKSLLGRTKTHERHETSTPTEITNSEPGIIHIISTEESVIGRGLVIHNAGGKTEITAHNSIWLSAPILNHTEKTERKGVSFSLFNYTFGSGLHDTPLFHADPLYSQLEQLSQSQHTDEWALNIMNTAVETTDALNNLSDAIDEGEVINEIAERVGIHTGPSLSVGVYEQKSQSSYQNLGPAGIESSEVVLTANETVELQNMPIDCDVMTVNAKTFSEKGTSLQYSMVDSSRSASVSIKGAEQWDVTLAANHSHAHGTDVVPQQTQVKGTLTVNAEQWIMESSQDNVGHLEGTVDKITLITTLDEDHAKQESYQLSTGGAISFNKGKSDQTRIGEITQLHIEDGNLDNFHVGEVELTGAKITSSQGNTQLHAKKIISHTLPTSSTSSAYGFNTNLSFFGNQTTGKTLPTLNVSHATNDVQGQQQNVIHGAQGTIVTGECVGDEIHTVSPDGYNISKSESHNRVAKIVVPNQNAKALLANAWCPSPPKQSVQPIELIRQKFPELTEEQINEKTQLMYLASVAVYNEDFGKAKLSEYGYTLSGVYIDKTTDTAVAVFINEQTHQGCIAFRGSVGNAWITDDLRIPLGLETNSTTNPQMSRFLDEQFSLFPQEEYSYYLTGHSRGATQGSIISDHYGLPAFVFENPGVASKLGYTFDKVVSFQSLPNIVNRLDTTGRSFSYGLVVELAPSITDQIVNNGLQVFGNTVNAPLGLGAQTFFSHSTRYLGDRLEATLEKRRVPVTVPQGTDNPLQDSTSPFFNAAGDKKAETQQKKNKEFAFNFS